MRSIRSLLVLLLLSLPLGSASAAAGATPPKRATQPSDEATLIDAIWQWHRAPVVTLVKTDAKVDMARFQRSVDFFASLTGVTYEHGSDIGLIPSPELAGTLARWDAWYAKNKKRLRVNSTTCLTLTPR